MERKKVDLWVTAGLGISNSDGTLVPEQTMYMATELFYPVSKGDYVECVDRDYAFAVATFAPKQEDKYIYSYEYKQESAWVVYRQDLVPESYSQEKYVFVEDGYCRICVKRCDGAQVTKQDEEKMKEILHLYVAQKEFQAKECFVAEIKETVRAIRRVKNRCFMKSQDIRVTDEQAVNRGESVDGMLSLCLLTDSHYTVNGTWEDTSDNIQKTLAQASVDNNQQTMPQTRVDAIVHLGDFTDGMTSKRVTTHYVDTMLADLQQNKLPVYVTIGNHDYNFFRGNKQRFSKEELLELFGLEKEYYYVDFEEYKIRCLFLFSYDVDEPVRYGFSDEEVEWVRQTLEQTREGYKVVIFSHEAPLDNLDYFARLIRNGKRLVTILEEYNARDGRQILAYIHGHTHADYVYEGCSFPIISIGSNKCESFPEKKPAGAKVYERKPGTVTQDLWDILLVDSEGEKLHFVRFGAGEDWVVECHKRDSTWRAARDAKRRSRSTKIWAHRGASGFAPENTLPSFAIAKELDVDGIELDVQMTKDGELVVIHDESIDRVSDGKGLVKDYTLEELCRYNFAKNKPGFGFVTIPTLREVYELFQDTDYVINVELKTGDISYVEERVHALTAEMGMTKQVIYSSFHHASILKMQQFVTEERTAFLFRDGWLDVAQYGAKHGVQALHPDLHDQNLLKLVEECHAKGMKVHVWTVNDEDQALELMAAGVDAIITDHPGRMREAFGGSA